MIERIDEVLSVLQDLRRSEMEELEKIEAREGLDLALHRPEAGQEITRQR